MIDDKEGAQNLNTTTVDQVDVNLDEIFGMPGAESVMLPETENKQKTVLSGERPPDLSFIDKPADGKSYAEKVEEKKEVEEAIAELDGLISQEEDAGNKGRPKLDKSGLYDLASKMIEEGGLVPFDDDKPLEEYTTKDFR